MMKFLIWTNGIFKKSISTIETIFKIIILSSFKTDIITIKPQHQKVLLLANGPSLKSFDYSKFDLSEYDLLTVNFSPGSDLFKDVKPNYHIINAPELWKDNVTKNYVSLRIKLFTQLKKIVDWPLILFIPFPAKRYDFWQQIISKNENIQVVYYNPTPVEGFSKVNQLFFRKNLGMPRPHNVVIPSLMLLINIGYQEIYLLGVDHSWLCEITVDENNEVLVRQKHFYTDAEARPKTMMKKGKATRKLHEVLHKFYLTFQGYFTIRNYATSKNVKIYNATPNSFIDAFERKAVD